MLVSPPQTQQRTSFYLPSLSIFRLYFPLRSFSRQIAPQHPLRFRSVYKFSRTAVPLQTAYD